MRILNQKFHRLAPAPSREHARECQSLSSRVASCRTARKETDLSNRNVNQVYLLVRIDLQDLLVPPSPDGHTSPSTPHRGRLALAKASPWDEMAISAAKSTTMDMLLPLGCIRRLSAGLDRKLRCWPAMPELDSGR